MALPNQIPQLTEEQKAFFAQGYKENLQELLSFEPSSLITFYELEFGESVYRFFSGVIEEEKNGKLTGYPFSKEIIYDGKKYFPIPCEADGFEVSSGNKFPRPKIRISNIVNKFRSPNVDEEGYAYMSWHRFISTMMRSYNELQDARLTRKKTFLRFIDDVNFDGGNPFGAPNPYAVIDESAWIISQKTNENKFYIEFELTSVFDVEEAKTPNRRLGAKYCGFVYRGEGCRYSGLPISDKNGNWFKYLNRAGVSTDVVLNVWQEGQIQEYDPTNSYHVGDVCYVLSVGNFCKNEEGKEAVYNIGGVNLDFLSLRTYYVCIKANDLQNKKDPTICPDYWVPDCCGKTLKDCCLRYGKKGYSIYNDVQVNYELPFGGFPGIDPLTYV